MEIPVGWVLLFRALSFPLFESHLDLTGASVYVFFLDKAVHMNTRLGVSL
jgi:hypothetical protein